MNHEQSPKISKLQFQRVIDRQIKTVINEFEMFDEQTRILYTSSELWLIMFNTFN